MRVESALIDFSSQIQNANTTKTALKVAFEAIPQFTHHRNYLLVHIDAHSNFYEMDCIYSDDKKIFERSMLHMASFESLPSTQWKGTLNNASKFLPILPEAGIPSTCEITLMPALHNGQVTAYLILYNLNSIEPGESTQSLLMQFRDILASALSNITLKKQLQYQADHDSLTGLPNRKLIKTETEKAIQVAHTQHHEIAIMILDIDRFKMINDSMGHIIGDELLRQLANRLSQFTSRRDLLSRFAGDEFVFLFTSERESIRNTIPDIIDRLDRVFIDPYSLGSRNVRISASKGIAIYPDDGDTFIDLLKNADAAMYKAKRDKPGSHAFFSKSLHDSLSDEMEIEQDLIDALTENQFELYYQPSIHLPSGNMIGAEALLRWHRPGHAMVSPDIFIELAEDTGLIEPIGNWVIKQACESFLRWQQQGIVLEYISINVSSVQLKSSKFVDTVKHILHVTGMKPTHLELEITETAYIKDYQASLDKLKELRTFGVKIAIDDFGTGYASLKYLKQLPADRLKIDRLFIKDLPENPNDAAIISSLVTLTKELNLELIAEGIEKDAQRDHLIKAGVMMAQGYLMSPPLSNEDFKNYYISNRQVLCLGSFSECSE
ncbi:MAG: EAL domain-containing protein [Candidatus Thiodiazotropha sp.]|nr:EAL domain-containing protein [Candidatus Thiodiazotropha sp.]MCM8885537.1 EAL domain-containing protein [Candidatus Thiodiazotropha sp.]